LTTTFAPVNRETLAAFMAVNATPGPDYGQIRVLQLPRNTTIPGPGQVQNNFEAQPSVAETLSLLRRGPGEAGMAAERCDPAHRARPGSGRRPPEDT